MQSSHSDIRDYRCVDENDNLLWLFVIADHVRYIVYDVIMDDCRRPDLGFTVAVQQAATHVT